MITVSFVVRPHLLRRLISPTLASLVLPITLLVACTAKLTVFPEVSEYPKQVEVLLRGVMSYEGKSDYLPRTIAGGEGGNNRLSLYYGYEDSHSRNDLMRIRQFTAIHQVGSKSQYVAGKLEIRDGEKILKTYTAIATLTDQGEFSETLSEMRRRGLIAVRDNIEAQMYLDSEFLKNLSRK
jgi:hypothetical protein